MHMCVCVFIYIYVCVCSLLDTNLLYYNLRIESWPGDQLS
jgi:hypothetical protein